MHHVKVTVVAVHYVHVTVVALHYVHVTVVAVHYVSSDSCSCLCTMFHVTVGRQLKSLEGQGCSASEVGDVGVGSAEGSTAAKRNYLVGCS